MIIVTMTIVKGELMFIMMVITLLILMMRMILTKVPPFEGHPLFNRPDGVSDITQIISSSVSGVLKVLSDLTKDDIITSFGCPGEFQ